MKLIDNRTAFLMLLSHAASNGRGELLFGDCMERVKDRVPPFLGTGPFPDTYLEFPLLGDPFLDVTVLYDRPPEETRISLPPAENADRTAAYLNTWLKRFRDVVFGFEIDTKRSDSDAFSIGLQPYCHTEIVGGFCDAVGEPLYGKLFNEMFCRLKDCCRPSYLGLFRGRPGSPLRIGGYLSQETIRDCVEDPHRVEAVFEAAGFTAYDQEMIGRIVSVFALSPETCEFQFDVYPDGTVGPVFSVTTSFAIQKREAVLTSFKEGDGARYMDLITGWGIADDRWKKAVEMTFAGAVPLGDEQLTFSIFPQWFKVSWNNRQLKPAKAYMIMKAGELGERFETPPIERIADYWNCSAPSYDEGHDTEDIDRWKAELSKLIGKPANRRILDVGTGTGFLALMIAELGFESYGIDVAEEMMKRGRENAKNRNVTVHFITAEAGKLPWGDNTFSAVVNARLLWTLMDPVAALKEWRRVLEPGGKMIAFNECEDPALRRAKKRGKVNHGKDYYGHDFEPVLPLRTAEPEEYERVLKEAGYRNVRVFYMPDGLTGVDANLWRCIYGEK